MYKVLNVMEKSLWGYDTLVNRKHFGTCKNRLFHDFFTFLCKKYLLNQLQQTVNLCRTESILIDEQKKLEFNDCMPLLFSKWLPIFRKNHEKTKLFKIFVYKYSLNQLLQMFD